MWEEGGTGNFLPGGWAWIQLEGVGLFLEGGPALGHSPASVQGLLGALRRYATAALSLTGLWGLNGRPPPVLGKSKGGARVARLARLSWESGALLREHQVWVARWGERLSSTGPRRPKQARLWGTWKVI